jgi:type I restriction enzyme, R subunit
LKAIEKTIKKKPSKTCVDEKIAPNELKKLLDNYALVNRLPRDQEIVNSPHFRPKIFERTSVIERVADKIKSFIDTFIKGMGGSV